MKEKWNELKKYPLLVLFFVFLFGFMFLDMAWPKREYSDLERRDLAQVPEFSLTKLFENVWTSEYDTYTKDQVVGRDMWLRLQSRSESLVFQKEEIGGALLGDDEMLFTQTLALKPTEERILQSNIQQSSLFAQRYPGKVTLMITPSASVIYPDKLPTNAPLLDENALLDTIFDMHEGANCIDLREAFSAVAEDTQLYYKTDHHWTTDGGAYLAYQEYCRSLGLTPMEVSAEDFGQVPDFYGTTYSKCLRWDQTPDTISYLDIPNQMTVWKTNARGEATEPQFTSGLYEMEKAETADKYAMFLYGNQGYVTIEGSGEGRVLVVKDSYANSFVPYLTENYAEICVIDPRSYRNSIDALMQREQFDQVLLLFSFQTYSTTNISSYLAASASAG